MDASLSLVNGCADNTLSSTGKESYKQNTNKIASHEYNPTYAVRGATLARPEGFCLCLDNDYIESATNSSSFQLPSHAKRHSVPCCIDKWMNDYDDSRQLQLRKTLVLSPHQRKTKQNDLAKLLKMVVSSRGDRHGLSSDICIRFVQGTCNLTCHLFQLLLGGWASRMLW
jgi:hypothetical protein